MIGYGQKFIDVYAGIVFGTAKSGDERLRGRIGRTVAERRERAIDYVCARLDGHEVYHVACTGRVMRVDMQLGLRLKFSLYFFYHFIRRERQQQVGHVLHAYVVCAHILKRFGKFYKIFGGMHGASGIRYRRLAHAPPITVFFDGFHRSFEISHIVERIEYPYHADSVLYGLFDEFFNDVVGVMAISQKILPAQEHLYGRLFEVLFQIPQSVPRVLAQIPQTRVESRPSPCFERIVAHIVELRKHGLHLIETHTRSGKRLMRVAKNSIGYHNFMQRFIFIGHISNSLNPASSRHNPKSRHATAATASIAAETAPTSANAVKHASRNPAAIADAITPATLGPMACIRR